MALVGVFGQALGAAEETKPTVVPTSQAEFNPDIFPIMKDICFGCHGNKRAKAELNLELLSANPDFFKDGRTWEHVSEMLRHREMPPENKKQPTEDQRIMLIEFIEKELAKFDCSNPAVPVNPGRVTLRRLNRSEYNNTIRDLFGVDYQPAADFPNDEVGYGFDNIGDVLSMSPILMEKYLRAAEEITAQAIRTDIPAYPPEDVIRTKKWGTRSDDGAVRIENDNLWGLFREGNIDIRYPFRTDGEYLLQINAYATLAGPELPKMQISLGGKPVKTFEVNQTEEKRRKFIVKLNPGKGNHRISIAYMNNYVNNDSPDPTLRGDRNLFIRGTKIIGPLDAPQPKLPESHRRVIVRQPNSTEVRDVARESLTQFAGKAFRRPVSEKEINRLLTFVDMALADAGSFELGMQLAVQAILISPHFLFRWELDTRPSGDDPIRELTDWELASRLSYFIWSSLPDDELRHFAKRGELSEPDVMRAQIRRMIADPKSDALIENFAGQWLQIRNLSGVTPDPGSFPTFDDTLRLAMKRETEMFFGALMREDRSVLELIDSDFTYLNERLAKHYGIDGVEGSDFQRVSLAKGSGRGGILTHASILTITSNSTRTSPVLRGKWILEQILGTPPPPPPPDVEELEEDEEAITSGSLRERLEKHREKTECATCHSKMDPLGFALENFDGIGAWRDVDGKFPIDPSGELPTGEEISGPDGLKKVLKSRETFIRTLSEKLLTFSLGRGLEYFDKCAVDEICRELKANNYRFSALLGGVVNSKPFRYSNLQTEEDE
ncbi:MAG: DUF1592 domain-containing protein [Verrucomicrobia bacterium]|nr:DUF1592 domain-containing protein [Verrucomicrobiota bacterium]